jgi:ribose 5-phosphate isomerase B
MGARVVVASDHAAVELRKRLSEHLRSRGYEVKDLGPEVEERVDYPDMAVKAVEEYRRGGYAFGLLLCGTGIGISIAANKLKGVRCALLRDTFSARMAKAHNDANFIAFGGRVEYAEKPEDILDAYLDASFEGGRHKTRVDKIDALHD